MSRDDEVRKIISANIMKFETPNLTAENIAKLDALSELFPGVVTEGKVNFDLLRSMLGDDVFGDEAYEFTWVGKRAAIAEAGRPIRKTLRPCVEESKDWDTTENLYIEGDNLDVLKLLQESYLGKVKMIYIDPPYNTGSDFIYRDDFSQSREDYEDVTGVRDEDDNRLFKNTEANGRFHSDWCSMIYPRLVLARNLLRDDGVIFVSCDDNEVHNARKIFDEVFGGTNFVTQFVWAAGRKNDSKLVSVSHEYILCYAKSKAYLQETQTIWRERKQGLDDIYAVYAKLKKHHNDDCASIQHGLKEWYKALPKTHPARNHAHYSCVDKRGIYFPDNISWPGGGGPQYDVLHPVTRKPVRVPSRGWMFATSARMQEIMDDDRVHFGPDENAVPCIKSYLKDRELNAPYSVFYKDGRASTKRLRTLMGGDVFENPKDEEIIQGIIEFTGTKDGVILDFFSGSATTAHAVLLQNAVDDSNRKFILVQLPEPCDGKTDAGKAAIRLGLNTIAEIGKERIRRAGEKIKDEADLTAQNLDIGFRVLKLSDTNMNDVYYTAGDTTQELISMMEGNIKPDRADIDLLYGCLLDWGLPLSMPHTHEVIDGFTVHTYNGGDLMACFEERIGEKVIREIAGRKPLRAVFRDSGFSGSPEKINVFEIFKLFTPNTNVKVI
ncbi:MAG: site-specific DNA-methyltransferase [Holophagales bacterium]|jgi:adenine-specific DNA-methyltransferase|nr:site-specific DNA-methyltransferase [Holophagales bacterium]